MPSQRQDSSAPIEAALDAGLGGRWRVAPLAASGFTATWRAEQAGRWLFVKSLPAAAGEPLRAEADGLAALAATGTIRVPRVEACIDDTERGVTLLALEGLDLRPADAGLGARLGHALAALHRTEVANERFGWHRDNWLGATPQRNRWSNGGGLAGWIEFWSGERLGAMNERLAAAGHASAPLRSAVERVIDALPRLFDDGHEPRPSLIHGDLWSGNWGMLADGTPVIYDPAVSVSDAEAELAMMELFGAPPAGFWPAYCTAAGLDAGYARRQSLYQLYHLLNHALLFGGGYGRQAVSVTLQLEASLGW